jgi:hypothetical protein
LAKAISKKGASTREVRLTLRALIYRESDWWLAHCLELDLVAEGKSPQAAFDHLLEITNMQIVTAIEAGDLESIFRPAPPEIQATWATSHDRIIRRKPPANVERFDVRTLAPV